MADAHVEGVMPRGAARLAVETDRLLGLSEVWLGAAGDLVPEPSGAPAPSASLECALPGERAADGIGAYPAESARPAEPALRVRAAQKPVSAAAIPYVVAPDGPTKAARLDALRALHDAQCPHCTSATAHTQTVFGEGDPDAALVFVGEAPGETEDQLGRPFVGRAGQKLDEMIKAMRLRREDVYIANILKSRPPENRTPLPTEVERCAPYLAAQLLVISPKAIVSLGGPATKFLLGVDTGITKLRGQWAEWVPPAQSGAAPIPVMPTYHPAYLLRNYTAQTRGEVWSDLKKVMDRLTVA